MIKVAILGAGEIGRAVYKIITDLREKEDLYSSIDSFIVDSNLENIKKAEFGNHYHLDISNTSIEEFSTHLFNLNVTHVINALPFFLNEKVAKCAVMAKCHYIDFTEDDLMADKVQALYKETGLHCAVKCGLAPGFINYIGHNMSKMIDNPESLMISVGALPRLVSYDSNHPEHSYNLTWSVDGLVNEYIRPSRIRKNGVEQEIPSLTGIRNVVVDGIQYEAAFTSGGVGSLVRDLKNIPNVFYMTLRYPGHYKYVKNVIQEKLGNFDEIKKIFLNTFPYTDDDVIVVYAELTGMHESKFVKKSFYNRYYSPDGLTSIQSTTAGAGVAVLELMFTGKLSGMINHTDVDIKDFTNTLSYKNYYVL